MCNVRFFTKVNLVSTIRITAIDKFCNNSEVKLVLLSLWGSLSQKQHNIQIFEKMYILHFLLYLNIFPARNAARPFIHFGPRVYPMGSILIVLVCLSFCLSVFKYLRDCSLIFLKFLWSWGVNKVKKVTWPKFWRKNLNRRIKGDYVPKFGVFGHFL